MYTDHTMEITYIEQRRKKREEKMIISNVVHSVCLCMLFIEHTIISNYD